jgi:hypothetical protein
VYPDATNFDGVYWRIDRAISRTDSRNVSRAQNDETLGDGMFLRLRPIAWLICDAYHEDSSLFSRGAYNLIMYKVASRAAARAVT